jgi:hypothetical protein
MSTPLGKVTEPLPEARGPDVTHSIAVPREWFTPETTLLVKLPRLLCCAVCSGGGCDACLRRGALELRTRDAEPEVVSVRLSELSAGEAQLLRIPNTGGESLREGEARGCLLLRITPGAVSAGVERVTAPVLSGDTGVTFSPLLLAALVLVVLTIVVALLLNR